MKSYGLLGILGLISLSAVFTLSARAEDAPHVFISEINWAGSEKSTADEWIELVNLGSTPVDLSQYVLTGTATSGGAIQIADGTVLAPSHTLVIANYALGDPKTTLLISPDLVTTAISLPNTSLEILFTTPQGLVLDSYTDTGTPDFGASKPVTSVERDLTTLTWHSSTANLGLSSISQFGTPGSAVLPLVSLETELVPSDAQSESIEPEPVAELPVELEPVTGEPLVEPIAEITPSQAEEINQTPTPEIDLNTEIILETQVTVEPIQPTEIINVPQATPATTVALELTTPAEPIVELETETTPPVVNTPSVQKITPGELRLNELVSDPSDGVEWVEIWNAGSADLDLTGSSLRDAGDHLTPLPNLTLLAGAFLVIENPNGNLNNTGDSVTLSDSYGTELDTLTYGTIEIPAPTDGESLARNSDDVWVITEATRNTLNIFPDLAASEPRVIIPYDTELNQPYDTNSNASDSPLFDSGTAPTGVAQTDDAAAPGTEPIYRIVALAKPVVENSSTAATTPTRKPKQQTSTTTISGVVVALPDTFGKQTMFIEGHEIYFNAADWPTLALGDIVSISGTLSEGDDGTRIKIKTSTDIQITGHRELVPSPIEGSDLATTNNGSLVTVSGLITGKSGDTLTLKTADGTEITVVAHKKTGVSWSKIQSGNATFTGIVRVSADGHRVYVRSGDDVQLTPTPSATLAPLPKAKSNTSPLVGGGLLTGSLGALGTWYLRSRTGILAWLPF